MGIKPAGALVVDIDSTICEAVGKHKQGAGYGYTRKLGYHPLRPINSFVPRCHARS